MQHVNVALKYKSGDVFTIYPLGDLHVGNASCDMKKFEESINEIKNDDSAIVVMMGDLAECIVPADKKRFNFDEIHPMFQPKIATLPSAYLEYLTDILNPIKNKIIGIHKGNHEGALLKYYFRDIIAELCGNLGVKYLPGMAFTKINFSYLTGGHQQSLIMNTSHGHKAGRKSGAKVNFMEDLPSWIDAQVILRGHCFSEDTELLTCDGWKSYEDVKVSDPIYTFNKISGSIEKDFVLDKFVYDDYTEMVQINNDSAKLLVTDKHNIVYRYGNESNDRLIHPWLSKPANEFLPQNAVSVKIPVAAETFNQEDLKMDDCWIELIAWIISEGHFRHNSKRSISGINLYQQVDNAYKIRNVLNECGLEFSEYVSHGFTDREFTIRGKTYKTKREHIAFYIKESSAKKIKEIITSKSIPSSFINLSKRQFDLFLKTLIEGDGCINGPNTVDYYSKDEKLIDDLQILCLFNGYRTTKRKKNGCFEVQITGRTVTTMNHKNLSVVPYAGKVWCVSTNNQTVIVRRKGKPVITGNSHSLFCNKTIRIGPNAQNTKLIKKEVLVGHTGSFLSTYVSDNTTYAEDQDYAPSPIGTLKIFVELNNGSYDLSYKIK